MTGLVTDARVRACALLRSVFNAKIFAVLALVAAAQLGLSAAAQAEIVQQTQQDDRQRRGAKQQPGLRLGHLG